MSILIGKNILLKAKYIRRWKGKDGKYRYEYGKENFRKIKKNIDLLIKEGEMAVDGGKSVAKKMLNYEQELKVIESITYDERKKIIRYIIQARKNLPFERKFKRERVERFDKELKKIRDEQEAEKQKKEEKMQIIREKNKKKYNNDIKKYYDEIVGEDDKYTKMLQNKLEDGGWSAHKTWLQDAYFALKYSMENNGIMSYYEMLSDSFYTALSKTITAYRRHSFTNYDEQLAELKNVSKDDRQELYELLKEEKTQEGKKYK